MNFHIISIFPKAFKSYLSESIILRAAKRGLIGVNIVNPRDFTADKHRKADDRPFGGGPGMVMKAEPILKAVEKIQKTAKKKQKPKIFILSPRGEQLTNKLASKIAKEGRDIVLICGRYEGIDARVKKILKAEEVSVGPYILTGGELPAMVMIDAVTRQIKGALGKEVSLEEKRIASGEVYTRPPFFKWKGKKYTVPKILTSGHHGKIEEWRKKRDIRD